VILSVQKAAGCDMNTCSPPGTSKKGDQSVRTEIC